MAAETTKRGEEGGDPGEEVLITQVRLQNSVRLRIQIRKRIQIMSSSFKKQFVQNLSFSMLEAALFPSKLVSHFLFDF
jgi:hypothetical protein